MIEPLFWKNTKKGEKTLHFHFLSFSLGENCFYASGFFPPQFQRGGKKLFPRLLLSELCISQFFPRGQKKRFIFFSPLPEKKSRIQSQHEILAAIKDFFRH